MDFDFDIGNGGGFGLSVVGCRLGWLFGFMSRFVVLVMMARGFEVAAIHAQPANFGVNHRRFAGGAFHRLLHDLNLYTVGAADEAGLVARSYYQSIAGGDIAGGL